MEATLSRALELNDQFFQQERDKLEAWADDRIASAEQALTDTKLKLKGLKRQARMALSMEDAQRLQQDIRKTETEQRHLRQDIFAVEDEIEAGATRSLPPCKSARTAPATTKNCLRCDGTWSNVLEITIQRHVFPFLSSETT